MNLTKNMIRIIVGVLAVAVVAVGAVYILAGSNQKKLTANFASGVGVYPGTPVKILGIQVGTVTKVTPDGGSVRIEMNYDDKYRLPANASAFLVANSLVSDRYVQLAPAYTEGAVLPSGGTIPLERTASPAELDDIYSALNQLSVALGPNGANKTGALSELINVGAANLDGNGKAFAASIKNLSQAAQTLSNSRSDLFGTITNLRQFTDALNQSDAQVRHFEEQLAQVAGDLADERSDLGAALHNLGIALDDVGNFVKANAGKLHTDIVGLKDLTNILVKEKGALNEALITGPIALSNLTHGYQENTGTLGTRSNLANLTDPSLFPKQICDLLGAAGDSPLGQLLLGNLLGQISTACDSVVTKTSATGLSDLTGALTGATAGSGG
ncbi:MAG: phospholipid/cholesterol/gamma-HCH transport system substrate-binding protein [Pseudonocardiales bacterium]|jgi:phospholipid/cholesterol/gamma-HCH transport system substrate-binding protein|nr:phospholipid/cholesterol/gamma-HCH transport system substrate-binding protein [Pseudonocardiales bacterium]